MVEPSKKLINDDLPLKIRSQLVPAVQRGYAIVNKLHKEVEWLDWIVGKNYYGHLRNAAVSFAIKQRIVQKNFGIDYRISTNNRKNHFHLELITKQSVVTISHVANQNSVPRPAVYRKQHSLHNQLQLIDLNGILTVDDGSLYKGDNDPYYMILTHGSSSIKPEFICLGVPQVGVRQWIHQIDLLREPRLVENELPEIEKIDNEELLTFKEQFKKGVQGDGKEF